MSLLVETPPLPVTRGPLGLLAFAAEERQVRRPIGQLREILDGDACPRLTLDERGLLTFYAYIKPTVEGRAGLIPPLIAAAREDWVGWFRQAGYLHNGFRVRAMRPTEPVRLYRGATPDFAAALSWTPHRATAEFYAKQHRAALGPIRGREIAVFTVTAQPSWVLARNGASPFGDHGAEYVVDIPADVEIHEVEGARP